MRKPTTVVPATSTPGALSLNSEGLPPAEAASLNSPDRLYDASLI